MSRGYSVTTLEDILALRPDSVWPDQFAAAEPSRDPLRSTDRLREAIVLDVRCECVRMTAAVLIDMRFCIGGMRGDAALIVARGVRHCAWEVGPNIETGPLDELYGGFWWIGGSDCQPDPGHPDRFTLRIDVSMSEVLTVRAERFDYFLADVPDLPGFPDMQAGPDALVRASLPDWTKPVRPIAYSRRDPARR